MKDNNNSLIYERILKMEKKVTPLLKKIAKQFDGKLVGLGSKLKKKSKIKKKQLKHSNYMKEPRDILRYMVMFSTNEYVSGVSQMYSSLLDNEDLDTRDEWNKQSWCLGDMYQGINTSWKYKGKDIFEIQFHTPDSFNIKSEKKMHDFYDTYTLRKCNSLNRKGKVYKSSKCGKAKRYMLDKELEVTIPNELDGPHCGTPLDDFKNILSKKKKRTKRTKRTKKRTLKKRRSQ